MAANSKHYGDIYEWLIKVVESCVTKDQHFVARKLVRQFQTTNLKTYNLPVKATSVMYRKLEEVILDNLNKILRMTEPPQGDVIPHHTVYPANNPPWNTNHENRIDTPPEGVKLIGTKTDPDKGYYGPLS